jgi:hypothetical protein
VNSLLSGIPGLPGVLCLFFALACVPDTQEVYTCFNCAWGVSDGVCRSSASSFNRGLWLNRGLCFDGYAVL